MVIGQEASYLTVVYLSCLYTERSFHRSGVKGTFLCATCSDAVLLTYFCYSLFAHLYVCRSTVHFTLHSATATQLREARGKRSDGISRLCFAHTAAGPGQQLTLCYVTSSGSLNTALPSCYQRLCVSITTECKKYVVWLRMVLRTFYSR